MDLEQLVATTAKDRQYGELVHTAFMASAPTRVRAALAYATQSGVAELCATLGGCAPWRAARKQWLIGIDYCRSDPKALDHLASLTHSAVKVHDGTFVAARSGCTPRVSYHPKLYLFSGATVTATIVGSGNLSQTGLRLGIEAAASLRSNDNAVKLAPVAQWYEQMWRVATPYEQIAGQYAAKYNAESNRRQPAPIDDDAAPEGAGTRGQLTPEQLRQLRVCQNLWIEAGNLHKNLGADRPGNQLMLKRNARVYFGFQARDLVIDTLVGLVAIRFGANTREGCSLRSSNNSMDVLALPIPGEDGPAEYDQKTLLFRRIGVRQFLLSVGTPAQVANWRRQSDLVAGRFQMKGGREWGVF